MSWLGCFGVLPSPNHVLAKLAIFRGAEFSSHSPCATDSAAMFYYYFKPFATPCPRLQPLSPSEPLSFASFIPQFSLPPPLGTIQPPSLATFPERTSNYPLTTPPSRLVPPGGDENFQTSRDRNRIVISRGSRPSTIRRPNSLFLLCPWADVSTSKVFVASTLSLMKKFHFFLHKWLIKSLSVTATYAKVKIDTLKYFQTLLLFYKYLSIFKASNWTYKHEVREFDNNGWYDDSACSCIHISYCVCRRWIYLIL